MFTVVLASKCATYTDYYNNMIPNGSNLLVIKCSNQLPANNIYGIRIGNISRITYNIIQLIQELHDNLVIGVQYVESLSHYTVNNNTDFIELGCKLHFNYMPFTICYIHGGSLSCSDITYLPLNIQYPRLCDCTKWCRNNAYHKLLDMRSTN